jgi:hypothetical protein
MKAEEAGGGRELNINFKNSKYSIFAELKICNNIHILME